LRSLTVSKQETLTKVVVSQILRELIIDGLGCVRINGWKEDITLIKEDPDFVSYPSKGTYPSNENFKPHYH
jgi:hypothetical protein